MITHLKTLDELKAHGDNSETELESVFEYAKTHGFEDVHIKIHEPTKLEAIIAIHSTKLGPALGGCRCIEYPNKANAILDALRLSRAMSYKAALVNIPFGGGKAVLMKPKTILDRKRYFETFGQFVNKINGRYITAEDSGSSQEDMEIVNSVTPFVAGLSKHNDSPSPYTAQGVLQGIKACVKFKLKKENLKDIHVAIQGVGKVGYHLCELLSNEGANITIADSNPKNLARTEQDFKASVVSTDEILTVDCDIFSPCALGSILNEQTISKIKAPIVAGSANNQLRTRTLGKSLQAKNILYAPDYVINAGGLIYASSLYSGHADKKLIIDKVEHIYHSLMSIFERSRQENQAPNEIADAMAQEKL